MNNQSIFKRNKLSSSVVLASFLATGSPVYVYAQESMLEEILVTATRRAESVQDIPYNISAVTGDALKDANVFSLADLTQTVPGVAFADLGVRSAGINNMLILRGLNANQQGGIGAFVQTINPAGVSTYMDNTPLFTNLRLYDIDRVEVLRGPQGTLYGSGALGGTLRFLFNKPDPSTFSASLDAGVSSTEDSDDLGYTAEGVLNIPFGDTVAMRLSGGYEKTAGYIDANNLTVGGFRDPQLANPSDPFGTPLATYEKEDTDSADRWNIRAAFLWDISDSVQAEFIYVHQDDSSDGFSYETAPEVPGSKERTHSQQYLSPLDREVDLYALEFDVDLGFARLESSTSFSTNEAKNSGSLEGLAILNDFFSGGLAFGGYPATNGRLSGYTQQDSEDERFVQELRLISSGEGDLDWVAGFYYEDSERQTVDTITSPGFADYAYIDGHPYFSDPEFLQSLIPGLPEGFTFNDLGIFNYAQFLAGPPGFVTAEGLESEIFVGLKDEIDVEDMAIYGELTYRFTDKWQATVGARYFDVENEAKLVSISPLFGARVSDDGMDPTGLSTGGEKDTDSDIIFRFNTSYDVTDDLMVYFNWAEGYRRGGSNAFPLNGFNTEDPSLLTYDADEAENWEIGVKGSTDTLTYTATLFYIEWDSPQISGSFLPSGFPAVVNAEEAETAGVELEGTWRINESWLVTAGYTYTDAELTEDFATPPGPDGIPDFVGLDGAELPGVPENIASLAVNYFQPINFLGFTEFSGRVDYFYRDEVTTHISESTPDYRELDSYDIWNASVAWSNEQWRLSAYVRNIADEEGFSANLSTFKDVNPPDNLLFSVRPRTFGLTLGYTF